MLAISLLLFWPWLNADDVSNAHQKNKDENDYRKNTEHLDKNKKKHKSKNSNNDSNVKKQKKKSLLTKDIAVEILLANGFLPELTPYAPNFKNLSISQQQNYGMPYETVRIVDGKKPALLHFWATWCGPCKRELPAFAEFAELSQDLLNIYTISPELSNGDRDSAQKIWNFYDSNRLEGLNVCADINNEISSKLEINGIPVTVLISTSGVLLGRFLGATDWGNQELVEALEVFLTSD